MATGSSIGAQADMLAANGRVPDAILLLNRGAAAGDPDALFKLATWRLEGLRVPRDIAMARDLFRRASQRGSMGAAAIFANFTAAGFGATRDWQGGLALLRTLAGKNQRAKRELETIEAMDLTADGDPASLPEGEIISTAPHVTRFMGLFSALECKYLIEAATPMLEPSVVIDNDTGRQIKNPIRTSDGMGFTAPLENPAVHALNRRIAAASGTTPEQGEPLQILRYRAKQEYKTHIDAIPGFDNQRFLTMLVYLNDDYKGGETRFHKTGLAVKGKRGDAILFRNITADGRPDNDAAHAGMPVTGGVKLIASRWIRQRPFEMPVPRGIAR